MKILHLITHFQRGGIEKWLLTMLKHVPRDSYQMDFCCKGQHTGSLAPLAIREGARVFHCPLGPWQIGFLWKLRSIVHSHNYDIIHNHLGAYSGLPLLVVTVSPRPCDCCNFAENRYVQSLHTSAVALLTSFALF